MSIDEAYDYINNSDNEFPLVLQGVRGLDRSEALRILAVLRWLQDNPRAQVMTANAEQPSGQTVREVLFQVWRDGCDYDDRYVSVDKAEAAINAHIVSVLEELKGKQERFYDHPFDNGSDDEHRAVLVDVIDAAIKRYKDGGNHE